MSSLNRRNTYGRITGQVNLVDFTEKHNPSDYLHYKFAVPLANGKKNWLYESIEKERGIVVYRGPVSYHQRKKGFITNDTPDGYLNITTEDELKHKMKEVLLSLDNNDNDDSCE